MNVQSVMVGNIEWCDVHQLREWQCEWICYESDKQEHRSHPYPAIPYTHSEIERELCRRRNLDRFEFDA